MPVNKFALFAIFHGIGGPKTEKLTFVIPIGWYISICPLNIKNNFGPLGVPILVPVGVLSRARQHIFTFCCISWPGCSKKDKCDIFCVTGWYRPICPLNIKNKFRCHRVPILAPREVQSCARQLLCTYVIFQGMMPYV